MSNTPPAPVIEAGSLPARVHALLKRNAGDEYSSADLALKFGVHSKHVVEQLQPFVQHGYFKREAMANGTLQWSVGPKPLDYPIGSSPPASAASKQPRGPRVAPLDADKLVVQSYDALPEKRATSRNYDLALNRLAKPGQMFKLPIDYRGGMAGAIREQHLTSKRRFSLRTLSAQEFGVYRLADATAPLTRKPTTKPKAKK